MKTQTMLMIAVALGLILQTGSPAYGDPNQITIDPHWSFESTAGIGNGSDVLIGAAVMYWPDYREDGGVGLVVYGGGPVPNYELLIGPSVEFHTGDIYEAALSRLLPNAWAEALGDRMVAVRPYGKMALVFDYEGHPILAPGTATRVLPNKHIQLVIRTDYFQPAGNSRVRDLNGWRVSLGGTIYFSNLRSSAGVRPYDDAVPQCPTARAVTPARLDHERKEIMTCKHRMATWWV